MNALLQTLEKATIALDAEEISYMIVGGFAMSYYNLARFTADIDIVVQIHPHHVDQILLHFPDWMPHAELFKQSISQGQMFNLIDFETGVRLDFMAYKDSDYNWVAFGRRQKVDFLGVSCMISSPEQDMDFSETNLPAPGAQTEAERAYTRWYAALPQERKARIFADMFQFGLDSVKYNAKKNNPFLTDAEATLRFIELHFKQDYSPEMFDFITKKMEERAEMEWKKRLKMMKKALGWSHDDIAQFMGAENGNSVKSSLARKIPAFAKLAICVFEKSHKKNV